MQTETLESVNSSTIADVLQNGFASHTRTHAEVLARDYEIINPEQVAEFIGENLFLIDLLEEIPAQIRKVFGMEQRLILRFFLDPEDPTAHCLHVRIPTRLKLQNARELLENFDESWWNENEINSDFKIFINLDFIK